MHAPAGRISALLLATGALAGCGASSARTVSHAGHTTTSSAQACLARFNASGKVTPYVALRRPITGGYVATDETLISERAACGVLLFIELIPHHGVVPMLFVARSLSSSWQTGVPQRDPLSIGSRARIPNGRPIDVANPSNLRLAP